MIAREWKRPGLLPSCINTPNEKPRPGKFQDLEDTLGTVRKGHIVTEGPPNGGTPQGITGTWVQYEGRKRGRKPSLETAADAGPQSGAQGRAAYSSRWRVRAMPRTATLHIGRGGGERVKNKRDSTIND